VLASFDSARCVPSSWHANLVANDDGLEPWINSRDDRLLADEMRVCSTRRRQSRRVEIRAQSAVVLLRPSARSFGLVGSRWTCSIAGSSWREGREIRVSASNCEQNAAGSSSPITDEVIAVMRTLVSKRLMTGQWIAAGIGPLLRSCAAGRSYEFLPLASTALASFTHVNASRRTRPTRHESRRTGQAVAAIESR
jgi:hypothetical protein